MKSSTLELTDFPGNGPSYYLTQSTVPKSAHVIRESDTRRKQLARVAAAISNPDISELYVRMVTRDSIIASKPVTYAISTEELDRAKDAALRLDYRVIKEVLDLSKSRKEDARQYDGRMYAPESGVRDFFARIRLARAFLNELPIFDLSYGEFEYPKLALLPSPVYAAYHHLYTERCVDKLHFGRPRDFDYCLACFKYIVWRYTLSENVYKFGGIDGRIVDLCARIEASRRLCKLKLFLNLLIVTVFASLTTEDDFKMYLTIDALLERLEELFHTLGDADDNVFVSVHKAVEIAWQPDREISFGFVANLILCGDLPLYRSGDSHKIARDLVVRYGVNGEKLAPQILDGKLSTYLREVSDSLHSLLGIDFVGEYYSGAEFMIDRGFDLRADNNEMLRIAAIMSDGGFRSQILPRARKLAPECVDLAVLERSNRIDFWKEYEKLCLSPLWKNGVILKKIGSDAGALIEQYGRPDHNPAVNLGDKVSITKIKCPGIVRALIARRVLFSLAFDLRDKEKVVNALGYRIGGKRGIDDELRREKRSDSSNLSTKLAEWNVSDMNWASPKDYAGYTEEEKEFFKIA